MFNPTLTANNIKDFTLEQYQDLVKELSVIDRESVEQELVNFTVYFSYYYGLLVRSKKLYDNVVFEMEILNSSIYNELMKAPRDKKLGVEAIKSLVNEDKRISELNKVLLNCEEIYGLMKGVCQTLDHKKDMLVQLSANKRMETKLYS